MKKLMMIALMMISINVQAESIEHKTFCDGVKKGFIDGMSGE